MGSRRSEIKDWRKVTTPPEVSVQVGRLQLMGNSPEAVPRGLLSEMKGVLRDVSKTTSRSVEVGTGPCCQQGGQKKRWVPAGMVGPTGSFWAPPHLSVPMSGHLRVIAPASLTNLFCVSSGPAPIVQGRES